MGSVFSLCYMGLVLAVWLVYEGQEEQGDVMGRPVGRV